MNAPPASVTITDTTGPGISAVNSFTAVTNIEVDFVGNKIKITHGNGLIISYYSYSALATLTWTITAGATVIVAST